MPIRCLLFLFFVFSISLKGQFYNLGQNPSSVKWRQIKTEAFQLIYPNDFEEKAQELANLLNYANKKARITLNSKPKRISIILQNNTTVDNGFVTLAPKRSEFYATPSQENEGVDWLKKLAVHEYRHVVQFEKYNDGVGKLLRIMFGEQGMGALILLTTPLWIIEGDAVGTETEHTERGRGEYGPFIREFKAQIMELDSMSYEKASFGSYRNFVTDHYKLGYFLSEFVKQEYGTEVWDSVLHCVVRNPFPPYPFSYHLKKITGKSTNQVYGDLIRATKKNFQKRSGFVEVTFGEVLSLPHKDYASYENPIILADSSVIAVKKSFNKAVRFIKIKEGKEQLIHIPASYDESSLSYSANKLIWVEKRRNPRWQYLDYSEVIMFDLKTKKRKRIKRKTRWFSPVINDSASKLAVVEYDKANNPFLLVVKTSGEVLIRLDLEEGLVYHPYWVTKDSIVVARLINGKCFLETFNINTGSSKKTKKYSIPFSYPKPYKGGFLIQTLNNTKDVIAWIGVENGKEVLKEVINPEFGLKFFSLSSDNEIVYGDYHNNGFKILKSEIEIGERVFQSVETNQSLLEVDQKSFEVKPYKPLLHLFNFHSWAPLSLNPNEENANLGASIFSQNILSSSTLSLNYDYYSYTSSQKVSLNYEFQHLYPTLYTKAYQLIEPEASVQGVKTDLKTTSFQAGSKLSLLFNGSRFRKSLYFKGAYVVDETAYDFEEGFIDTTLNQENTQWVVAFGIAHKAGLRDIYSPLSFVASSAYYINLKEHQNAQVLNLTSTFQGVMKNDGVKVSVGKQWGTDFYVPNYLTEPRGVLNQSFKRGEKFTLEYGIPVAYPDLKISRIVFLQRIRANAFYEYLQVNDDFKNSIFSSQGGTFFFDFNPFRYSYLTTIGLQCGTDRQGQFFFAPSVYVNY